MYREIKRKDKFGVSLMLSYVILVAIILVLSVGVYAWLKVVANVSPVADCKEDTSILVDSYRCLGNIEVLIKNNGRFNINGIILAVGNDTGNTPTTYLLSSSFEDVLGGHYTFNPALKPGEIGKAKYMAKTDRGDVVPFKNITVIQIQPFIIDKNEIVYCSKAVIKQNIRNCNIRL